MCLKDTAKQIISKTSETDEEAWKEKWMKKKTQKKLIKINKCWKCNSWLKIRKNCEWSENIMTHWRIEKYVLNIRSKEKLKVLKWVQTKERNAGIVVSEKVEFVIWSLYSIFSDRWIYILAFLHFRRLMCSHWHCLHTDLFKTNSLIFPRVNISYLQNTHPTFSTICMT